MIWIQPYKLALDRGLQIRIAPDGARTLLVRYKVEGSDGERQYRLSQEYGDGPGQLKLAAACAESQRSRPWLVTGLTGRRRKRPGCARKLRPENRPNVGKA